MRKLSVLMTILLLAVLATTAGAAYDYTIKGQKPTWWQNDPLWITAEWKLWNGAWEQKTPPGPSPAPSDYTQGMAPDIGALEIGGDWGSGYPTKLGPMDEVWWWSDEALLTQNVFAGQGIRVPGSTGSYTFDLELGNKQITNWYKRWYVEFEVSAIVQSPTTGKYFDWTNLQMFDFEAQAGYDVPFKENVWIYRAGIADHRTVWGYDDVNGNPATPGTVQSVVWWAEFYIQDQPDWERFRWTFHTDTGYQFPEFYVKRVTIGTSCEPEPSAFLLMGLACCLPVGFVLRRRKKTK